MERKIPLIVIAGPTAVGKSDAAAELARRIDGEVISADSMQVYRHMDIGTGKITREEMLGVPHHMIDVISPKEEMDASRYAAMAKACIQDIHKRGRVPILCGGTGFYIQAVVRDTDFQEGAVSAAYRASLEQMDTEALHRMLLAADPASAAAIHPNNRKRVVRALEYIHATGEKMSEHNARERERQSPYQVIFFFLDEDRETLYRRIEARVDFMMAEGLRDEVAYLRAMGLTGSDVSMQGIGYRQMLDHLEGRISEEEAVRIIKRDSRRYAKRQQTWFRAVDGALRIRRGDFSGTEEIVRYMIGVIEAQTDIRGREVGAPNE